MPTYTGPVPPTPTAASTDAQWQNWWAYQGVLRDLRYEDERAVTVAREIRIRTEDVARLQRLDDAAAVAVRLAADRAAVTDRQHVEKMAAEAACAAAVTKQAEAQAKATAAMLLIHTTPPAEAPAVPWTDEQLVRQFMFEIAATEKDPSAALGRAKTFVRLLRLAFQAPAPTAPTEAKP